MSTQRLASLGVDAVDLTLYTGGRYAVIQRDPQPDETGIPRGTAVRLRLADLEGDPADAGGVGAWGSVPFGHAAPSAGNDVDFEVYVDGALALSYVSGTPSWGPAWSGTVTRETVADPYVYYQVDADQAAPPQFVTEQVVPVRVVVTPSAPVLDVTYTFVVEDVTPPSILNAIALDDRTVRVQFSEAMAVDGAGSALLPGAYTITRQNVDPAPAVDLTVTAVALVAGSGDTAVDLTCNWAQTPGCIYELTVAPTVTDAVGNAIA